ncbi:AsmA family protein [Ancylomarina euxinus]|uniref:AsmA family protein n=1 Tax=Ancylomarina euxinus TaxID=2283627 RepID=A0A425Y1U2_9BACT|nr:AsmA-like C-terminal region-containing protein [Ancylomarina euxinus]MCZ4695037.1 AsmA family protein [Ancylomarina euxinus]MUP15027.1 AsmA family protein [Ancylomarina euxinus]RRG21914.1 AsmA family protein [Ancylomarina euxinus]
MKKFLKIFGGIILVLILLLALLPYLFKDQIMDRVKVEMDKAVDAKIEIADVSLSMFKSFPKLFVEIQGISIVGKGEFTNDTLAYVGSLYTAVDLGSAISGKQLNVGAIVLAKTKVNALVLESGKANWDISKAETEEVVVEEESTEASDFKIIFEEVRVEDFALEYHDATLKANLVLTDLDLSLNGDFSAKETNLNINSTATGITFDFEGIKYLKNANLGLEAAIGADLENMVFNFKENKLTLNDLEFGMMGSFAILEDAYNVDLKLDAKKTEFKSLLSMVPEEFLKDVKGLETKGNLVLNAFVKGEYREGHMPAFGAKLKVVDGHIKYPELPETINNIKIDAEVNHPGGDLDALVTDVNAFHFEVANNPIDTEIHIKTPMSDPEITGLCKGVIDFAKIRHAIPMDSIKIAGMVTSDISFNGRLSAIEKEEYEKFMAKGDLKLKDFEFTTPDFPQGIKIVRSVLSFTPRFISLNSFNSLIGKSDVQLNGKIENYIPYALKGKTLKGNFKMSSNTFDLNEFMTESQPETAKSTDTIPMSVITVPANLDIRFVASMQKIKYDKMLIEDVKGLIVVKNSVAKLTNLSMNMLKGQMTTNGSYSTKDVKKPNFDFGLDVKDFDIKSTYESLSMVKKMIPMALNCDGKVSSDLKIKSQLNEEMSPVMNTLNGQGSFHSRGIIIKDSKAFVALAKALKNDSYKRISVAKFDMDFVITNGNLIVKPFNTKIAGHEATIFGTQSVDGKLDFTMNMKLPKEELGSDVTKFLDKIPGNKSIDKLDISVKITGTTEDPKVNLDLSKAIQQAKDAALKELKKKGKKDLEKKAKDLFKKLF